MTKPIQEGHLSWPVTDMKSLRILISGSTVRLYRGAATWPKEAASLAACDMRPGEDLAIGPPPISEDRGVAGLLWLKELAILSLESLIVPLSPGLTPSVSCNQKHPASVIPVVFISHKAGLRVT